VVGDAKATCFVPLPGVLHYSGRTYQPWGRRSFLRCNARKLLAALSADHAAHAADGQRGHGHREMVRHGGTNPLAGMTAS